MVEPWLVILGFVLIVLGFHAALGPAVVFGIFAIGIGAWPR